MGPVHPVLGPDSRNTPTEVLNVCLLYGTWALAFVVSNVLAWRDTVSSPQRKTATLGPQPPHGSWRTAHPTGNRLTHVAPRTDSQDLCCASRNSPPPPPPLPETTLPLITCDTPTHLFCRYSTMRRPRSYAMSLVFRIAQESHADLREWYVHCIDFLALKRRLIDDPPDPYDDHPSMSEPSPLSASTAGGNAMGNGGSGGAVDGEGLLEREGLLSAEPGAGGPVAAAAAGGDGGVGAGDDAEGGICVVFPDPPSRVFAFEIKQVLVWKSAAHIARC